MRTQLLDIMQQHKVPINSCGNDWDTVRKVGPHQGVGTGQATATGTSQGGDNEAACLSFDTRLVAGAANLPQACLPAACGAT